jgi:hypothetical protein
MQSLFALSLTAVPRSGEADLIDLLIKIGAGLFFIGIPLIKGILQAREKAKEEALKSARRPARERDADGRRAFEELIRGGTTLAPPPVPTVPPPLPAAELSRRIAPGGTATRPLTQREELPAQPLTGSEFEAEEGAPEAEIITHVELRERAELKRQEEELRLAEKIAREEYAASSSLRADVAPVPVEVFRAPALEVARSPSSSDAARRLLGVGGGADRRAALRRALIMNEILGRPVATRDGSEASMPVGLRG